MGRKRGTRYSEEDGLIAFGGIRLEPRYSPERAAARRNREGAGCDRLVLPDTPSSKTEDTDHVDRPRSSAMPNVYRVSKTPVLSRSKSSDFARWQTMSEMGILQQLRYAAVAIDSNRRTVLAFEGCTS